MIKTNIYNVSFDSENHVYTLPSGEVLERARERGSAIHADIACYIDGFGCADTPEVKAFAEGAGGAELYSECLVSDGLHYASAIDVVRHLGENNVHLYDIKTTSVVDEEYSRWQLSIYANFMKLAGFNVVGASVLHVKDGAIKELPVMLVDYENVWSLLHAYTMGEDWHNPFVGDDLPEEVANNICVLDQTISGLKEQLKYAEGQMEEFKARLLELMRENDLTAIKTPQVSISIKKAYQRTGLDSKKLKEQYPEIAKECEKITEVAESLTIKIVKK